MAKNTLVYLVWVKTEGGRLWKYYTESASLNEACEKVVKEANLKPEQVVGVQEDRDAILC